MILNYDTNAALSDLWILQLIVSHKENGLLQSLFGNALMVKAEKLFMVVVQFGAIKHICFYSIIQRGFSFRPILV